MRIASVNLTNHDTGITIIEDGAVINTFLTERFSRIKHGGDILKHIEDVIGNGDSFSKISFSLLNPAPHGS